MKTIQMTMLIAAMGAWSVAPAQVGMLQGTVTGVPAGAVLPVFKGEEKVADLKVGSDGKYSLALGTGVYTVRCPNGNTPKIAALNGAAVANVNCQ